MTAKIDYKNCEVTLKRHGKVFELNIINISKKGYIMEINKTFILNTDYHNVLSCLNENIVYIEEIYKKLIKKDTENNSKIRDFE